MPPDEAEDFQSWATIRLIDNDYATFRKFQGHSKLSTYLVTVVTHLFLDYRNSKWGKWRASAGAKRLGRVAIQLESLVYRDGHSFTDATLLLRERLGSETSDAELEELFGKIKPRFQRRFEGEDTISRMPATDDPEADAMGREDLEPLAKTVSQRVSAALGDLDPKEALLLKLRFGQGMRVVDIAKLLQLEQRTLYTRLDQLLKQLKRSILDSGVSLDEVRDLLGWDDLELQVDYGDLGEVNSPAEAAPLGSELSGSGPPEPKKSRVTPP